MAEVNPPLLIITLNVNGFYSLVKKIRLAKWINKDYPTVCYQQETQFQFKTQVWDKQKHGKRYSIQTTGTKQSGCANNV